MRKTILAAVAAVALTSPALAQDMESAADHAKQAETMMRKAMTSYAEATAIYGLCTGKGTTRMADHVADVVTSMYVDERAEAFLTRYHERLDIERAELDTCPGKDRYSEVFWRADTQLETALDLAEKANDLAER